MTNSIRILHTVTVSAEDFKAILQAENARHNGPLSQNTLRQQINTLLESTASAGKGKQSVRYSKRSNGRIEYLVRWSSDKPKLHKQVEDLINNQVAQAKQVLTQSPVEL